jgi:hypothetical protein
MITPPLERQADIAEPQAIVKAALLALDADWMALADLLIGDGDDEVVADFVLLHPQRGIALIDVAPRYGGDPAGGFRKFLEHQDFGQFFPGFLPIVALVIRPEDAPQLASRLDASLGALPPLSIAEPDWAEMVNTLLVASETPSSADLAGDAVADEAIEHGDEPRFTAAGFAVPEPPPRDAAPWRDDFLHPIKPAAKIGPNTPRLAMSGPVADERFARIEERRRWPAVAVIVVVLLGAGVGWAAFHPSLLSDPSPPSARSTPADRTARDAGATPATPPVASAAAPAGADAPPVAQDVPTAAPTPSVSAPLTADPPLAASDGNAANPQSVEPAPATAAATPPPEPAAPAPAIPAPPSVATAHDAGSVSPDPARPRETEPQPPPPAAKPSPRNSVAAAKPPSVVKPAIVKQAQAPAAAPAPALSREARRAAAAEATDNLNRAELSSPTQPLRAPPAQDQRQDQPQDQSGSAPNGRSFGDGNLASRQAAPFEDRTVAALPPSFSPPPSSSSAAPPTDAQPAPTRAPGALSRPTSLLPSSRAAPGQAVAADGLPQGATLGGKQPESSDGRVCRIYNSTKTVLGRPQSVTGLACKGADGTWQLVTEAPAD